MKGSSMEGRMPTTLAASGMASQEDLMARRLGLSPLASCGARASHGARCARWDREEKGCDSKPGYLG